MGRLAAFALALAACYRTSNNVSCELTCTASCPGDLECLDGFCVAPNTAPGACTDPMPPPPDSDPPPPPDAPDLLLLCPAGYIKVGEGMYKRESVTSSWANAEAGCENDLVDADGPAYTHLAAITSDLELDAITAMILAAGANFTWIGFTDAAVEGEWAHVTGEETGFPPNSGPPWAQNVPPEPNGSTGENCAHLTKVGPKLVINDFTCADPTSAIAARLCECDTHKPALPLPALK